MPRSRLDAVPYALRSLLIAVPLALAYLLRTMSRSFSGWDFIERLERSRHPYFRDYAAAHPDTPAHVLELLRMSQIGKGLTAEQVIVAWGEPDRRDEARWEYRNAVVRFNEAGRVTSID